ncbi:MAG: hypothetical protein WAN36_12295 [Calditrichia bacterium]
MIDLINNPVAVGILIGALAFFTILHILLLLRIKQVLQQISFYMETISRFFYRLGVFSSAKPKKQDIPKTCQFCKHRLSFIHMSENKAEVEDFYYKCQLRNLEVALDDTCERYEKDIV